LAAGCLVPTEKDLIVGFVGCGRINYEIARFLAKRFSGIEQISVYDLHSAVAERFAASIREIFRSAKVASVESLASLLHQSSLISFATTAPSPYVHDLSMCAPSTVILNISLRDFDPRVLFRVDNIVDDIEHVCREGTSIHLAQVASGNRDFIRCSLAEITLGLQLPRVGRTVLFSPFGLGALDIAVATYAFQLASENGIGRRLDDFLPDPIFG
jgi:ornithine cyclodeaminase/alanine dehydrogenase-like protein (mu-crystallin family)